MAFKTRRQLVDQAAANLGVLTPGQVLSAEDSSTIDGYVTDVLADLEQREIYRVEDEDEIEVSAFQHIAVMVADAAKYEFGGGAFDTDAAERKLRHMVRSGPTYEVMKVTYY
jgi:hypothetical protein